MEKATLLQPRSGSPPPYEAPAYPRRERRRFVVRGLLSIRTFLSLILTVAVLWMCFVVNRQTQPAARVQGDALVRAVQHFDASESQCLAINESAPRVDVNTRTNNSRWTSAYGQNGTVILRNATLFDGETIIGHAVDITFSKGLIRSVEKASTSDKSTDSNAVVHDLHGRYVTPGLVDMHAHHFAATWPAPDATDDSNEMNPETKAFTPMVRIIDGLKAYDVSASLICSGGVTTSLIIPGSGNIIGGEGTAVKNVMFSGHQGEPVVEDLLLERGIPVEERRRYMKMAFGENPKGSYDYTRLGIAWHLREHLQKAKDLKEKQDDYCATMSQTRDWHSESKAKFVDDHGKFPFQLELDTSIALLRGRIIVQNHNYEAEDMETMLRISHEFGYRVWGFHHATEAWKVPEMLKEKGENLTIAIFAEFSMYKWEAYSANLYAGHVLDKHGLSVAYKSDHVLEFTNAKYLASQAAVGHSFHLPEDKALQSITSIPAKAIDLAHRVGYCRPGFDADITIWNSHPLSIGATPLQVFVDGMPQLDQKKVAESMGTTFTAAHAAGEETVAKPQMRYEPTALQRAETCDRASEDGQGFIITGIQKAFVENYPEFAAAVDAASGEHMELVIDNGGIVCIGARDACAKDKEALSAKASPVKISLQNGHVLPGLTAMSAALGMREISAIESTGDGESKSQKISDPDSLVYAKYGVWLDGKMFARARLGGVTRAISPPRADESGFVQGVSVEILTSSKKSLAGGGIVQGDVALHLVLGDQTKSSEETVSNGVRHLRKMLQDGKGKNNETLFGKVARGDLPLVVNCDNKYDMAQLVLVKKDYPDTNLVIMGGKEAPYVAKELAAAKIPIILNEDRPAPDSFRAKDAVIGPPLSRSVASHLKEAGVTFALSMPPNMMKSDYNIHGLGPEAGWTAKNAGLSEKETVRLITTSVESILGLKKSKDLVVFEGSPLRYGATAVLAFHADEETGKLEVATCFPREHESE